MEILLPLLLLQLHLYQDIIFFLCYVLLLIAILKWFLLLFLLLFILNLFLIISFRLHERELVMVISLMPLLKWWLEIVVWVLRISKCVSLLLLVYFLSFMLVIFIIIVVHLCCIIIFFILFLFFLLQLRNLMNYII